MHAHSNRVLLLFMIYNLHQIVLVVSSKINLKICIMHVNVSVNGFCYSTCANGSTFVSVLLVLLHDELLEPNYTCSPRQDIISKYVLLPGYIPY